MATLKDEVRSLVTRSPGLTDREITDRCGGASQQPTNATCHDLARAGELERRGRDDSLIGNYPAEPRRRLVQGTNTMAQERGRREAPRGPTNSVRTK